MNDAISPLDGRYFEKTRALAPYFSEAGLMRYRVMVEVEYSIALRRYKPADQKILRKLYENFSSADYENIKATEKITNHDVKAVEYFIKSKLEKTKLKKEQEWVHFALTSEDVNNIAYALMLKSSAQKILLPKLGEILAELKKSAKKYKSTAMLARTHGQPASPTTFGKEFAVFAHRLEKQIVILKNIKIEAKLNGATGNYNAHMAAYPKINWPKFSSDFIKKLGLEPNLITTQIESHDSYAMFFDAIRRINTILIDLDQDIWRYISDGWIVQNAKAGETGSSTMPHKINPINFENSEGNLGLANALLEFMSRKLPISRLQRDLSDSTVERNMGVALTHAYVAYEYLLAGLRNIKANEREVWRTLGEHPEVIAEAIQTILRREGAAMPYEKLKELTRGRTVTLNDLHAFINKLDVSPAVKKELLHLTPHNYIGLAAKLTRPSYPHPRRRLGEKINAKLIWKRDSAKTVNKTL